MTTPKASVCICTYKRPYYLCRLLNSLMEQRREDGLSFEVVVVDNDEGRSAEMVVDYAAKKEAIPISYFCEPTRNIALARNKAVENAKGELIACIDDDEFPVNDWLENLVKTLEIFAVSGVLGPVRPDFEAPPPRWIRKGRFFERPEYKTGTPIPWNESRSGNLLFKRQILEGIEYPFDPRFKTGGEDVDFFRRMAAKNCRFVWCNEAVAYESVPPGRTNRAYLLHRALLRGKNGIKSSRGQFRMLGKSLLASPLYLLLLPGTLFLGHHVFMKLAIKFCDHFGRLLAVAGLNPITERRM